MSSELNYTVDELLEKTPVWLGLVYEETLKQFMNKNGMDYTKIRQEASESKIIASRKALNQIGLGTPKRKK